MKSGALVHFETPGRPLTQLSLVFPRRGAYLDPPHRLGLTRLALRQMLMGAGGLCNEELNGRLERLGASTGFNLANDHFAVRLVCLSENLQPALELFRLSLHEPDFLPAEFGQLQSELVSAWQAERDESKQLRAREVYLRRIYGGGPCGFGADGTAEGLRAITVDEVRQHHQRLMRGAQPLLAALSDLPRGALEPALVSHLALPGAPGDGAVYPWDDFSPPPRSGRTVTIVADEETQTDEMVLGCFSTHPGHPDWHLHRLISLIFGGDMNSRLFRVVRGERGLSYGASCWYEAATGRVPRNRPAPFTFYSFPSAQHSAQALPLLVSLYENLTSEGVTEAELEQARKALINSHPFRFDTPEKKLGLKLQEMLYGVRIDGEAENRNKLEGVTREDLLGALGEFHHPDSLEIVLLGHPARLVPVAEKIPNVEKLETIRYP